MKPFHLIATPHRDILEGRLTMDIFAADLWEVFKGRAVEDYQDPDIFFRKTYLTAGLKNLLKVASKRLKGEGGDPVIQIQTPFGGGKTHALITLYHAFTNPEIAKKYVGEVIKANVVVLVGTAISPKEENGKIVGTLWGEIERQLEGEVRKLSSPISPGREVLRELLEKHQPLLILIDEILEYVAKAAGIKKGYKELKIGDTNLAAQTIAFMQELTETVKSLDKTLLVVTLPSSVVEYADEEAAQKLLMKLQKVAGRIEKIYTPVAGEEIYEVIRRRLFSNIDEIAAREIVNEFIKYYEREGIIVDKTEYRNKMLRSYPFHPEVIDVLHHRWGSIPTFQRTRGVLRILSLVVYKLKDSEVPLIRLSDFDLSFSELAEELVKHIGREYESVLSADITAKDANAKRVDRSLADTYQGLKLGTKLATAVFLYSFSGGEKGVTLGELKLACADINIPSSVITDVLDKLKSTLHYLWIENGKYVFKSIPNLNRIIASKMSEIDADTINSEIKSLLKKYAGSALPVYIFPKNSKDVPDTEELKLVILQSQDLEFMKDIIENYGNNPRVNKNTIFFLCPLESERLSFENWLRRKLAWESIANDKSLNLTESQKKDVEKNLKEFKRDERHQLRSLYRLVYVPAKEFREIDLKTPVYGDKRPISKEVFEILRAEGEIVEKLSPHLILEKYLGNRDYLEIKQLYKTLLTTPGEPRISKQNFIKSIKDGVKNGIFGFGIMRDNTIECTKFKEIPDINFEDYEIILRKELCERKEETKVEAKGADVTITAEPTTTIIHEHVPEQAETPSSKITPPIQEPTLKSIMLKVKIPKGKFSDFYRGVIMALERSFEKTDITIVIEANKGCLKKSDYENKIRETLLQINASIIEEKVKE